LTAKNPPSFKRNEKIVQQNEEIRAVFVDRDGTLNFDRPGYVKSPDELEMIPGACEQIARMAEGCPLILVITNQSVVGRGIISEATLKEINEKLELEFYRRTGRKIDDIFYCPHKPDDNCECRKPKTKLIFDAARLYNLDLKGCVLVGDKRTDEEAAINAGCSYIGVGTNTTVITTRRRSGISA